MSENSNIIETKGISGYHLKMIALVTMFIDHVGATILWRLFQASYKITAAMQMSDDIGDKIVVWFASHQEQMYAIYEYMRLIGRMAFPIYCFLLVEGFLHTRNVKKYAFRLFVFALISEIPFDFALEGTFWNPTYNNVFFTLLLGLLCINCLDWLERMFRKWQEKKWNKFIGNCIKAFLFFVVIGGMGMIAEEVLMTDYGLAGVAAIVLIWLFRRQRVLGFSSSILALGILSSSTEYLAICMLPFILKYDGTRGKQTKYLFYAFYPVHLFLLGLVCVLLGV
uniref:TraX family protein n=1 Tax=Agathobacter sp. TaxID=2021311 RepID=UPI004057A3D8